MIQLVVRNVKIEHLELFRAWMAQVNGPRRQEALATLADEGCSHELAVLIEGPEGPVVIYAMEVESVEHPRMAANSSKHAIDKEHLEVVGRAIGEPVLLESLLDLFP